ncbi:hypothetical protein HMPREF9318_00527 [Streptococcus urinalis FB127-CNA-2]|uniref:Type I restriction modification DNA specificity domain protein n=1 Tax=Streptococcus urinalis 2285-97 TaxID=764291 RepID=G5KGG2_9STRE|nr:restriction endonuclease subunit S [Streptococcus urinalis]EHJ56233.1 type I restriction modification DNA specificity domain protein [Streptococcus urinalis 2285-97]EKS22329.1 hypothetical protein HMPREF9318_00527 [Streptococcus urinalis FB127-CNA-2]VEF32141.1 type I restriction- system specificity subunit [Streptococcus urinalis]
MNQLLKEYLNNDLEKIPLGDVVDCFKGKAISSKVEEGNYGLINLVDIDALGISYDRLRTVNLPHRQLLRYFLEEDDVLIASKGTVKKIAVFNQQDKQMIASSNITILRPTDKIRGHYIKFFLETEVGKALLEEADHGKNVINLSTKELLEIPIPVIPLVKQDYLIGQYLRGLADYKRKLARAEMEWQHIQKEVRKSLI